MDGWLDVFAGLATFALTTSITPGPNNLLLLNTGARYGFRRGLPVLLGIQGGFLALVMSAHRGLGLLLEWLPGLQGYLAWACGAYMAWLAWRIFRAPAGGNAPSVDGQRRAPRWFEGALLQLANPKAWGMAVAGASIATSTGGSSPAVAVILVVAFAIVGIPCSVTWLVGGAALRPMLGDVRRQRDFNRFMASLLLTTAVWIVGTSTGS
jgi:threonine/homoserine/homoserine lactone efflux protein